MNSYGKLFKITTFGESHGPALGVTIDGLPSNFHIDINNIKHELERRKPGQSSITTQRKEADEDFEILSGIFEGKSTGHPITIIVRNKDQHSKDYDNIKDLYRPNHADYTYDMKYGIRDYRGGGRSSGRETISRVIAGSIAKQYLKEKLGLEIFAYTKQVSNFICKKIDLNFIEKNILRIADPDIANDIIKHVENINLSGNSIGGIIECLIKKIPSGLGEPVFDKIKSRFAHSMLSIGGVLGFEYGAGFNTINLTGKDYNEGFINTNGKIHTKNNKYEGILGGISTGEDIQFRVAIKPTSSIYNEQKTINTKGNEVDFKIKGRHDSCILPRVIPVIEAMTAIDILDLLLIHNSKIFKL